MIPESPEPHTLFEKLFEASPDAIVVTNAEGRITSINSQVERLFGYVRQELIGQDVEILVPERFRQMHPAIGARTMPMPACAPWEQALNFSAGGKTEANFLSTSC